MRIYQKEKKKRKFFTFRLLPSSLAFPRPIEIHRLLIFVIFLINNYSSWTVSEFIGTESAPLHNTVSNPLK